MPKLTRRNAVKLGVLASAIPAFAKAEDLLQTSNIHKALFDTRYAGSRDFAEQISKLGGKTIGVEDDVTQIWYDDLYYAWQKPNTTIIGLTKPNVIIALQLMAHQQNKKVIFAEEWHGFENSNSTNAPNTKNLANSLMQIANLRGTSLVAPTIVTAPMQGRQNLIFWAIA